MRQEDALEMGDPEEQLELLKGEPGARWALNPLPLGSERLALRLQNRQKDIQSLRRDIVSSGTLLRHLLWKQKAI